jgi:hypothetical protein
MKTLDEIRAFWSALPCAAYFGNAHEAGISAVESADVDARVAENGARRARARHRDALAALRAHVEADAAEDWPEPDRQAARAAALACSLDIAANPPPLAPHATTKEDVDRHRRIARETIGFGPG